MMTSAPKPPSRGEGPRKSQPPPPKEPPLRCPRCDSSNTKFCYYNNYSLSQPRHFCRNCRRYWTRGGALRNVPIGGGSRKNRKAFKSCCSSSLVYDPYKLDSSDVSGGFKFLTSLASRGLDEFSLNPSSSARQATSSGGFAGSLIPQNNTNLGSLNIDANLALSIESLSSLNQDLHRKLQQQRLSMLLSDRNDHNQKEASGDSNSRVVPAVFQNLEIVPSTAALENVVTSGCLTRERGVAAETESASTTELFFGNTWFLRSSSPSSTISGGSAIAVNGTIENNGNMGSWHGFQAWAGDLHHHQFNNALP